jgi:WD40 repeat protein
MAVEPTTKHCRLFDNHGVTVNAVAVFPDGRMATKSQDGMIRLWSWENGRVLNEIKWKASKNDPGCLAISPDGRMIASGEDGGFVMAWDGTGKLLPGLPQAFKGHDGKVASLDFSPDCATLATASRVGSSDGVKLYNTQTWQPAQGKPITTKRAVSVRYSPSGEFLAIATHIPSVEIWNLSTGELIAHPIPRTPLSDHWFSPLQWTPDGTRVLTSGVGQELRTIAVWDLQNWTLGGPWRGHTGSISAIAVNRSGTLVASAADGRHPTKSSDSTVRLWRLSDGENIAIFQHSDIPTCVTFSVDGKYILSGGKDKKIAEWAVPADALPEDDRHVCLRYFSSSHFLSHVSLLPDTKGQDSDAKGQDSDAKGQDSDAKGQDSDTKGQGSGTKGSDTKRQHSDPKVGFHP